MASSIGLNMAYRATSVLSKNRHIFYYSRINSATTSYPTTLQQIKYSSSDNGNNHHDYDGKSSNQRRSQLGVGVTTAAIMSGVCLYTMMDDETQDNGRKKILLYVAMRLL